MNTNPAYFSMPWLLDVSAWIIPVVLAIMLHEVAHGWVAGCFGDPTARNLGRITLNPIRHVDRFGTIVIPAMLIIAHAPILLGYAKPVPVNFALLRPPRIGMAVVALAGPVTNVIMALICGLLLHIGHFVTPEQMPWLFENLYRALAINCGLATFNMLPILPLDGGRVVYAVLRGRLQYWYGKLERRGIWIVFGLLLALSMAGVNINEIIAIPVGKLLEMVLLVTGNSVSS